MGIALIDGLGDKNSIEQLVAQEVMMEYSDNLKIAIGAAINAGIEIIKIYESDDFGVEIKGTIRRYKSR